MHNEHSRLHDLSELILAHSMHEDLGAINARAEVVARGAIDIDPNAFRGRAQTIPDEIDAPSSEL